MTKQSKTADYVLPSDAPEAGRLNYQHRLLGEIFGGLYRAPLEKSNVRRVLDLGCGTGNWAIDFAKQYPEAEVYGVDITEDPQWQNAPANCTLSVADFENSRTWYFLCADNKFDVIHGRMIVAAVRDWPTLFARCFEHLTPGGWIELQDVHWHVECEQDIATSASRFLTFGELLEEGARKIGLSPRVPDEYPEMLMKAGFAQVKTEPFRMITGSWPEDERERHLGEMGLANMNLGIRGFSKRVFTGVLGWSTEAHEKFIQEVLAELEECRYRLYLPLTVCFAQKPA